MIYPVHIRATKVSTHSKDYVLVRVQYHVHSMDLYFRGIGKEKKADEYVKGVSRMYNNGAEAVRALHAELDNEVVDVHYGRGVLRLCAALVEKVG